MLSITLLAIHQLCTPSTTNTICLLEVPTGTFWAAFVFLQSSCSIFERKFHKVVTPEHPICGPLILILPSDICVILGTWIQTLQNHS